jgi:hypothetical protein
MPPVDVRASGGQALDRLKDGVVFTISLQVSGPALFAQHGKLNPRHVERKLSERRKEITLEERLKLQRTGE